MIIDYIAVQNNDSRLLFPYERYKSGNKNEDEPIYKHAYPNTKYPIIIIPDKILLDDNSSFLNPGYYEVAISNDEKFLLLIQAKKLVLKVYIINFEKKIKDTKLYEDEAILKEKLEEFKFKKKRKKVLEIEDALNIIERKKSFNIKAQFITNQPRHYIIKYEDENYKATGYILKR